MLKKMLLCTICALSFALMSCEPDGSDVEHVCIVTNDSIHIVINDSASIVQGGGFCEVGLGDVMMRVSPYKIKQGEELTIALSHKKSKNVEVEISSLSLDFEDVLMTPATIKKEVLEEGKHDLTLVNMDNRQHSATINIICYK